VRRRLRLRYGYKLLTYVVKVHYNLRLFDKIEDFGHNDANIEWFSYENSD